MKSFIFGVVSLFLGVSAHADWNVRVIEDHSVSRADVPRMVGQYPAHVALLDRKHFATAYSVEIRSETWTWVGPSVCSATDPRLNVGILRISVAAYMDNGKTTYGVATASGNDPDEADPCR